MKNNLENPTDELLVKYILGELNDSEQLKVEKRLFEKEWYYERIELVEEELIDDYIRGELSNTRKVRFEELLNSSNALKEKLKFSKLFLKKVDQEADTTPLRQSPLGFFGKTIAGISSLRIQPSAVVSYAIATILCFFFIYSAIQINSLRNSAALLEENVKNQSIQLNSLITQLNEEFMLQRQLKDPMQTLNNYVNFVLKPGRLRNHETEKTLLLSSSQEYVVFELDQLNIHSRNISVYLSLDEGPEVWSRKLTVPLSAPEKQQIFIAIPTQVIQSGKYVLTASDEDSQSKDFEEKTTYVFEIIFD